MRFLLLLLLTLWATSVQSQSKIPSNTSSDCAVVTPRRIERHIVKGEDDYEVVTITPVLSGLDKEVLIRIRKQVEIKRILDDVIYKEYKKNRVIGFEYEVTQNQHHILGLTFTWHWYFKDHETTRTFDLRTGSLVTINDLFREDSMSALAELVDGRLQTEIKEMIRDYHGSGSLNT